MVKSILAFILFFLLAGITFSQKEGDRIIAIIGNEVILESDLNFQLVTYLRQNNLTEVNDRIIQSVFQNMVTEKLILAKAEQDSITVGDEELTKQVDGRLKQLVDQFGSEKNLEEAYGITIIRIKNILREQISQNIKVERVKQQKFGYGISVTRSEVEKFYHDYKDSIPPVPETFDLYQIVRVPKITEEARQQARIKAQAILDSIRAGTDFSDLARRNSEDPGSAPQGGLLGKSKKGSFVKEFEDAAFLLNPGQISELVETEFGYHIIKLIEKSGDFITAQHILVKFPRIETADFEEINFLKSLKTKILNGEASFKQLAAQYSQEQKSALDSGYIGKIGINDLDSAEIMVLKDVQAGGISDPVKVGDDRYYAYYIYMVADRIPEHKATLEGDYKLLEQFALKYKEQKILSEWIEELKKTIYVEIKI
ncbi:MAG TPA: peptidylprolyl isomerase [Ignavibacteria bacterium]